MKKIYEIDGKNFNNLEEFALEFSRKVLFKYKWNGNLDALNDILYGGFGTPDEGFILIWKSSEISKEKLRYFETINWLENTILKNCHPTNIESVKKQIEEARQNKGKTLFEIILEIIAEHNDIELRLE